MTTAAADLSRFSAEHYRHQPVFGIEIRGADGKIRFGSMLSEEEKHWLVADLRRTIWPEQALS